MTIKRFAPWLGAAVPVILLALWAGLPLAARADCGETRSYCYRCHQAAHPVSGTTELHSIYGHRYACWQCHWGDDTAQDKEQAHVGLISNPLENPTASCSACHAEDIARLGSF